MRKLLIATRSSGKYPEILALLAGLPVKYTSMNDVDLPQEYDVEEPAMTLEGNAIVKAMTLGKKTGLLSIAEDTGLEVDALGGRPGVHTKRYVSGSDADRYLALLGELVDVPEDKRTARFRTVAAIYDPNTEKVRTCEGVCEGKISHEPKGEDGFGYDPVFFHSKFKRTFAELSTEEKNAVSHRGQAFRAARAILEREYLV